MKEYKQTEKQRKIVEGLNKVYEKNEHRIGYFKR